jgi:YcxB-like protein
VDIRVTVEPDPRALARGMRYLMRLYVQWVRGVGLALAVVALVAFVTPGWWLVGVVAVLAGVGYQFMPWLRVRRGINGRSRVLDEPHTFTFTEQGVGSSSATRTSQTAWSGFPRIVDTGVDLLLMPSKYQYVVVPRAAFTPQQFEELTAFLSGQGLLAGRKR